MELIGHIVCNMLVCFASASLVLFAFGIDGLGIWSSGAILMDRSIKAAAPTDRSACARPPHVRWSFSVRSGSPRQNIVEIMSRGCGWSAWGLWQTMVDTREISFLDREAKLREKKTAKICAETLNATIVGGKKGGWYHDDVWNMRYLRHFKWDDLMEQVQRERGEREARRRVEDARAARENREFVGAVERARMVEGIRKTRAEKEGKRRKKVKNADADADAEVDGSGNGSNMSKATGTTGASEPPMRTFRQNEVKEKKKPKGGKTDGVAGVDADTKRVLGKIF